MTRCQRCLLLLNLSLSCTYGYAQTFSQSRELSLNHVLEMYHSSAGDQSGIYNGSLYLRYQKKLDHGHPYFRSDSFSTGRVLYDETWYENLPLLYDEVTGDLVTKDISGINLVKLVRQKITRFEIHGVTFTSINDSTRVQNGSSGFYRLLYDGDVKVLHKETKFIRERIVAENETYRSVETKASTWLRDNARLAQIENQKHLLGFFGDSRKAVHDHLRSVNLNFRKQRERTIIEAARFFEKLASQ